MKKRKNEHILFIINVLAEKGWSGLTKAQLQKSKHISVDEAEALSQAPEQVIALISQYVTEITLNSFDAEVTETEREALFELFMTRFEVMQDNREAFCAIHRAARENPCLLRVLLCELRKMVPNLVRQALPDFKMTLPQVLGLMGIYMVCVYVWVTDESADLSATMAALDKNLGMAERAANFLNN